MNFRIFNRHLQYLLHWCDVSKHTCESIEIVQYLLHWYDVSEHTWESIEWYDVSKHTWESIELFNIFFIGMMWANTLENQSNCCDIWCDTHYINIIGLYIMNRPWFMKHLWDKLCRFIHHILKYEISIVAHIKIILQFNFKIVILHKCQANGKLQY